MGAKPVVHCTGHNACSLHLHPHISHPFCVQITDRPGQSSHGDLDLIITAAYTIYGISNEGIFFFYFVTQTEYILFSHSYQKQTWLSMLGLDKYFCYTFMVDIHRILLLRCCSVVVVAGDDPLPF